MEQGNAQLVQYLRVCTAKIINVKLSQLFCEGTIKEQIVKGYGNTSLSTKIYRVLRMYFIR